MALNGAKAGAGWRWIAAALLIVTLAAPLGTVYDASAQTALPATAAAAPESTVFYHEVDLDPEGEQWQQAEALLARVGLPDALDLWEDEMLREGARKGDFTEADLQALLGGELAVMVSAGAVEHLAAMHQRGEDAVATPMAEDGDEVHGVAAVLLPGDPDAAWAYAERQLTDYAAKRDVPLETETYNGTDILWIAPQERAHDREAKSGDDPFGQWMGHHRKTGIAVARAGDFIIAGPTTADVTAIIDVVDGTTGSLADVAQVQDVRAELPASAVSFTYFDGPAIVEAIGPELLAQWSAMSPDPAMVEQTWRVYAGLTIGADEAGFRVDSVMAPGEGGNLDAVAMPNDPTVAAAAERAPADALIFEAGLLPENAFAGLAYIMSQAVNGTFESEQWESGWGMQEPPTPEEMEAEIAQASATLGFDPAADLFNLLGGDFILFSNLPDFMSGEFIPDAVMAVRTSDPATMADTVQKLVTWIEGSEAEASVSERSVGSDTVYTVADAEQAEIPGIDFGVVEGQAAVGTGGGIDDLVTAPDPPLSSDPQYQEVMGHLPSEYSVVAYVNIGLLVEPLMMVMTMMDESAAGMPEASPAAAQAGPQNVRALASVAYRDGDLAGSSTILYIAEPGS